MVRFPSGRTLLVDAGGLGWNGSFRHRGARGGAVAVGPRRPPARRAGPDAWRSRPYRRRTAVIADVPRRRGLGGVPVPAHNALAKLAVARRRAPRGVAHRPGRPLRDGGVHVRAWHPPPPTGNASAYATTTRWCSSFGTATCRSSCQATSAPRSKLAWRRRSRRLVRDPQGRPPRQRELELERFLAALRPAGRGVSAAAAATASGTPRRGCSPAIVRRRCHLPHRRTGRNHD